LRDVKRPIERGLANGASKLMTLYYVRRDKTMSTSCLLGRVAKDEEQKAGPNCPRPCQRNRDV
jgi:hypothetical protein